MGDFNTQNNLLNLRSIVPWYFDKCYALFGQFRSVNCCSIKVNFFVRRFLLAINFFINKILKFSQ